MEHNYNQIDEIFKQNLENLAQNPSENNWQFISEKLQREQIDEVFSKQLTHLKQTPAPKNWQKISQKLPINLYVRRRLEWLSRVAAVLVVGMLVFTFYQNAQQTAKLEQTMANINSEKVAPTIAVDNNKKDVISISTKKPAGSKTNSIDLDEIIVFEYLTKKAAEKSKEEQLKNEEKLRQILQPLQQLPWDAAIAFSPKDGQSAKEQEAEIILQSIARDSQDLRIATFPAVLNVLDENDNIDNR